MDYEPTLKISSRITDSEGDNFMETTVRARLRGTKDDYTIEYSECILPGITTNTQITVAGGKSVTVVRSGEIANEITAEQGKRHICHYSLPFGSFEIGIYGRHVSSEVSENGGRLDFEYDLCYPDGFITTNAMTLDIYRKGAPANV